MPTKQQTAWKKYYRKNKEKLKQRAREAYYAKKGKVSDAEFRKKRKYLRRYYRNNKAKWASHRRENREKINAAKRKQYREDEATREYYKNQAKKANNPDKNTNNRLLVSYGITAEKFQEMLKAQGGSCAICGTKKTAKGCRRMSVDHCHKSRKIRGILCSSCNFGLGIFKDDPHLLLKAAAYLKGPTCC